MSIDRTAWVGYGVTGIIDDPSDLLRESTVPTVIRAALDNSDYDLETQMDEWLAARGVDIERVTVFVSGNSWAGVERWNVVAGQTWSVDESDPLTYIDPPTQLELDELEQALELLGVDRKPSLMMQMDVQ